MATPSSQQVLEALSHIKDPDLGRDVVSLGMIKELDVTAQGRVSFTFELTTPACPVRDRFKSQAEDAVNEIPGVTGVEVRMTAHVRPSFSRPKPSEIIPGVKQTIAVASGKGGVGKSTVAVNLALAMGALGWRIGLMDADVYGPSVAMMVGARDQVRVTPERRIVPLERFGIRYVSMALFIGDDTAVIWRGPMVTKLESEFLFNVEWGELDCLVLDLPPGTGDAQLTITQRVTLAGGVIVTTPQEIALLDVKRGVSMFAEVDVPVLGVIENMSYYLCRKCGHRHEIFAHGGGARFAHSLGVPFLGELPIVRELREGGDEASPLVAMHPEHPVSAAFKSIAANIIQQLDRLSAEGPA